MKNLPKRTKTKKRNVKQVPPAPEPPDSLTEEETRRLLYDHTRLSDKHYRMHAQRSCNILSYRDRVLELELILPLHQMESELKLPIPSKHQLESYLREPLLKKAEELVVHIMYSKRLPGLTMRMEDATTDRLAAVIQAMMQPVEDIKVTERRYKIRNSRIRLP